MVIDQVLTSKVDFSKYAGQWVVICRDRIVAHDKNLSNIEKDIKACKKVPTIAKIPKKETLIF